MVSRNATPSTASSSPKRAYDFFARRERIFPAVSGLVTATVTDSNVYAVPGSSWELRATPNEGGGSRVEMAWIREFKSGPRGSFFNFLFGRIGDRIFGKYSRDVLKNLEKPDEAVG